VNAFRTLTTDDDAANFVRRHSIDVFTEPEASAFAATLDHAAKIGPLVRLVMSRQDNAEPLQVELQREAFDALNAAPGKVLFVRPRRVQRFDEKAA
jgi:hypothetical protein